jgi:hypothetical protein
MFNFVCGLDSAAEPRGENPSHFIRPAAADKIAYEIRAILQSEWFRRLFKARLNKSKLDDLVTTAGGGVRSVSLEGGLTRLGAEYIIIDDAVQIKDADNDKQLERVNARSMRKSVRASTIKKRRPSLWSRTVSTENDLPGHVLAEGGWKVVKLPLIAPRARTYETDDGFVWQRHKGELLRPNAFTTRDIGRLRRMKRPDFETLQQQNPGERDRLRVKAEHIGVFRPEDVPPDAAVVLSIDPGQKGGPSNSCHVLRAWVSRDGRHFLVDQWRDRCAYRDFRTEVYGFIRRWRPSAILIEATGNGLAPLSDIRAQLVCRWCRSRPWMIK